MSIRRTSFGSFASRSSSFAVPPTFASMYRSISYMDWPVPVSAARCTTIVASSSASRRSSLEVTRAVDDRRDAVERAQERGGRGGVVSVHLRDQRIEHRDGVAGVDEAACEARADETGAAGDEHMIGHAGDSWGGATRERGQRATMCASVDSIPGRVPCRMTPGSSDIACSRDITRARAARSVLRHP